MGLKIIRRARDERAKRYEKLEQERQRRVKAIQAYVDSTIYGFVSNSLITWKYYMKARGMQ